jgi:zinc transport system substrate-binding protein
MIRPSGIPAVRRAAFRSRPRATALAVLGVAGSLVTAGLTTQPGALARASSPDQEAPRLRVAAIVGPQAWLAGRIGGERVAVTTVVAPGESPATFDPTPRQLTVLADVDLLLRTGVPLENGLLRRLGDRLAARKVVDLRDGLDLMEADHRHDGQPHDAPPPDAQRHGRPPPTPDAPGAAHDHEIDPHVWLSPRLLVGQVRTIADALIARDPAGRSQYLAARDGLLAEIATLDAELTALLAPVRGRELFVFHPAFGYLARDYGLVQVAIEEGGLAPTPRHLAAVLSRARERGARAVFVQPQFSGGPAARVARELGLELVELDPLVPDVVANLRQMGRTILDALAPGALNR